MGVPDKPSHRTHTDTGSAGLADTGQPPVECRVLRRCDPVRSCRLHHPSSSISGTQQPTSRRPRRHRPGSPESPMYLLQKSILLSPCITTPSALRLFLRLLSLNKQQQIISVSEERLSSFCIVQ